MKRHELSYRREGRLRGQKLFDVPKRYIGSSSRQLWTAFLYTYHPPPYTIIHFSFSQIDILQLQFFFRSCWPASKHKSMLNAIFLQKISFPSKLLQYRYILICVQGYVMPQILMWGSSKFFKVLLSVKVRQKILL